MHVGATFSVISVGGKFYSRSGGANWYQSSILTNNSRKTSYFSNMLTHNLVSSLLPTALLLAHNVPKSPRWERTTLHQI